MISKRKILSIFLFFLLFGSISNITIADTGTYTILDYSVKLTPHSDGTVEIEYYQKWLVTGGHIPWITIGTANSNYRIDQSKNRGNIRSIYAYNSSRWSGVRIDLDKDYLPDETFEVRFTLIQSKLFYADKENYKLDFTPGWYDRAVTEKLIVAIHFFAPRDRIVASPEPNRIEGGEMIWEKFNLGKGQKVSLSISFPKSYMPQASKSTLKSRSISRKGLFRWVSPSFLIFFTIWITLFIIAVVKGSRYGRGGSIFAAGSSGRYGRSSSGGGGFGGRSSSCACACASCACACACAGGGGAGCSKKTSHSCPICSDNKRKR
jgi:hypothetical protein